MHGDHALHDLLSRHPASLPGDHSGDRASGRDADLSFSFHDVHLPQNGVFSVTKKDVHFSAEGHASCQKMNVIAHQIYK